MKTHLFPLIENSFIPENQQSSTEVLLIYTASFGYILPELIVQLNISIDYSN